MNLKEIRISLIKKFIDFNERIFFERRLSAFFRNSPEGLPGFVIDVGANKGQSIDFFLKLNRSCQIYALEPNPDLYAQLLIKYQSNKNIKIFNLGVSNFSGRKLFFQNVLDYTSTFEKLNTDSVYLKRKAAVLGVRPEEVVAREYEVNVITLAEFINMHVSAKRIDVLKIDTEGHEFYCLEGLFKDNNLPEIQIIQLENHHDDMYSDRIPYSRITSLLEQNGFHEYKVVKHGLGDFDEVLFKKRTL